MRRAVWVVLLPSLLAICAIRWRPQTVDYAEGDCFVTQTYTIYVVHPCEEGCVACDNIRLLFRDNSTGRAFELVGSTRHSLGADGETPIGFQGYEARAGCRTYQVLEPGHLRIWEDGKCVAAERGEWRR